MYVKTDNDAVNQINLADVFYVDEAYSKNHAHMLHKHKGILELLYVSAGEGRYIVGSREYAVAAGDLIICNAETLHGEAPFQAHTMQTYCCALSGVHNRRSRPAASSRHTSVRFYSSTSIKSPSVKSCQIFMSFISHLPAILISAGKWQSVSC